MKRTTLFLCPILVVSLLFSSCESPTATGAVAGAGAGALLARAQGAGRHGMVRGAALGAAAGAVLGHIIGRADDRGYYDGRRLPYGRYVGRGMVESPYRPYNLIDVRGIPRGSVVEDPSTGGHFITP